MNHIIILTKDYFPENIKASEGDTITLLASADGVIPVSVYTNECFKKMNVEVIPQFKNEQELALYCAYKIGQLSAKNSDFAIYTSLERFSDVIKGTGKKTAKTATKTKRPVKADSEKESPERPAPEFMNTPTAQVENGDKGSSESKKKESVSDASTEEKKAKKRSSKAEGTPQNAKVTEKQISEALGKQYAQYAKELHRVFHNSNAVTFEMSARVALAAIGASSEECKMLAGLVMDKFGDMLPKT